MSQEPDRVVDRHEGEKGSQGQDVEGRRHQGHQAGPPETSIPLTTLTGFIIPLPNRAAPRIAIAITMTIATVPSLTTALYPTTATNPTTAIVPPTGEVC